MYAEQPTTVFHIAALDDWEEAVVTGEYRPASLLAEGFVHCSLARQVVEVADRLFRGRLDLVLLEIDLDQLDADVVFEDVDGDRYPHVYGPVNRDAVMRVMPFLPGADGTFHLPAGIAGP